MKRSNTIPSIDNKYIVCVGLSKLFGFPFSTYHTCSNTMGTYYVPVLQHVGGKKETSPTPLIIPYTLVVCLFDIKIQ